MKRGLFISAIAGVLWGVCAFCPSPAWAWRQSKVVSPEGELASIDWTPEEKRKPAAKRDLGQSAGASYHVIRLRKAEPLHMHDSHDLVVIVLKGTARIHFGYNVFELQKGDVTRIPRGVPHWVENTGKEALEAYAIYTPPSDGNDFHRLN